MSCKFCKISMFKKWTLFCVQSGKSRLENKVDFIDMLQVIFNRLIFLRYVFAVKKLQLFINLKMSLPNFKIVKFTKFTVVLINFIEFLYCMLIVENNTFVAHLKENIQLKIRNTIAKNGALIIYFIRWKYIPLVILQTM